MSKIKDNNIHKNHRQRLLKKAAEIGFSNLEQHEILEIMLFFSIARIDTNPIAHRLINEFKSIKNVLNASAEELKQVDGIGEHSAVYINMLKSFVEYCNTSEEKPAISCDNLSEVTEYCKSLHFASSVEKLYLLSFDSQKKLIKTTKISEGNSDSVTAGIRSIFDKVANTRCSYVVLCHNHPSGFLVPSQNDVAFTIKLKYFFAAMGITLSDHIIICGNDYISLRKEGYLQKSNH